MTLTELVIKRPSLVVVLFAILSIIGIGGAMTLRYELLPSIDIPVVTVSTFYPGASPTEVETNVSKKIEEAVSGLEKTSTLKANSFEGMSIIAIEFKTDADIDQSLQDAQRKINAVLTQLPKDAWTPIVQKVALSEMPILRIGVSSNMPSREFFTFMKDHIKPLLAEISGVGKVDLIGGEEREIKINLNAEKIKSYGLSIPQVTGIIQASNLDFPTGTIKGAETQSTVRIAGKFASVEALRELVIHQSKQGGNIHLRDVAEVEDGVKEMTTISRINGLTSIGVFISKQADGNTVEISQLLRRRMAELEQEHAGIALKFNIANDAADFTMEAAKAVEHDLILAILLVSGVMFVFLRSFRNSIIILVSIPCSMLAAFICMAAFGFSLNLMTLLALSLVIGILVDDSIVVLENIYHHLEQGVEIREAALRGRNEIGFAALSITLVDVVVFLPMTFVTGLTGDILREFCIVVIASTLMSLFVSFTVTPVLASRFSRLEKHGKNSLLGIFGRWFEGLFKAATDLYMITLRWCLGHVWLTLLITFLMFVGSLALPAMGLIGSEFIKESDRGEFIIRLKMPPGTSLHGTNRIARQIEAELAKMPEVVSIFTSVGTSGSGGAQTPNQSQLMVRLTPRDQRERSTQEISSLIKAIEQNVPGSQIYIDRIDITGEQGHAPINILISGSDPDSLQRTVEMAAEALQQANGSYDISLSSEMGNPEIRVEIDRQKMAEFGITVADVGATLQVALAGNDDSKYSEGGSEYAIRVQLDEFDRANGEDIARLSFLTRAGNTVQLQQFATIYQATGPAKLERTNRNASVMINSYFKDRSMGEVVADFQKNLGDRRATGTAISMEGDAKNQAESFQSLLTALFIGITFVYLIMVALYDSYIYPFVVLFSIPVAIVGALGALALTGNNLSIFSILGIIMMVGLVAKNAILLVDRTNETRATLSLKTYDALIEAAQSRMRPIVMTTLSMIIGMMPIAIAKGAGSEWKNGLAWALIGGLTSSMFLTLLLVPVVYTKVDEWKDKFPILFSHPWRLFGLKGKDGN